MNYGIVEGGSRWITYLPKSTGIEKIHYEVFNLSPQEKTKGKGIITIHVVNSTKSTYSQRYQIGGFKAYLDRLPMLERVNVIFLHVLFYLGIGLGSLFFYCFISKKNIPNSLFKVTSAGMLIFGIIILVSLKQYQILRIALSVVLITGGISWAFPNQTKLWDRVIIRFGEKYFVFLILVILNTAIISYHFYAVSLPAIALDSYSFIPIYDFFKYDIFGWTRADHFRRILLPFMASLVPLDDSILFNHHGFFLVVFTSIWSHSVL